MLVIARFSLGVCLQAVTPVGSAFFIAASGEKLRYVTLHRLTLPVDTGYQAACDPRA